MLSRSSIYNLSIREEKAWRMIDQCLIKRRRKGGIPHNVRLEAAKFILERLYPEKKIFEGLGDTRILIIRDDSNPESLKRFEIAQKELAKNKEMEEVEKSKIENPRIPTETLSI